MPEIVPVLEFMHYLNSEGIAVEYADAVSRPAAYWSQLAPERQAQFLADRGSEGRADEVQALRVVRKRGRSAAVENVFVVVEFAPASKASRATTRARNRVMYRAFEAAPSHVEALPTPADFVEGLSTSIGGPPRNGILPLLDRIWGGEPYDPARDGRLCETRLPEGFVIVEDYWLEEPFAKAMVLTNDAREMVYHVEEPRLTALEQALAATLNERLRDVLIMETDDATRRSTLLVEKLFELLGMYRFHTDRRTAYRLGYYFLRNYLGLGRIEAMMRDGAVEDISCNGPRLPVFVAHGQHQSLPTNVAFEELELNSFAMKLAQRGGKLLSVAQPLVDATLPGGSRLQATLGHEVTSRGSAFTIRKFREDPLTAVDLVRLGTISLEEMAMLWLAVEMRRSMIVMGATASGKTTTLNALGQFIPPTMKIVSIEDTREITLQHENWLAAVTREPFTGTGGTDRISMFDLLKAALRQRPDYLMVGEIRGVEGLTLFQAMSTGHTCYSTMHAGSVENAVYRLENSPINVPRVMLTSLDFFLTQAQVEVKGKLTRRLTAMTEINGIDPQNRNLRINDLFRYDPERDAHEIVGVSQVFDRARQKGGWTRSRLDEEFIARKRVLELLLTRNERHYSDVAKAVRRFYSERLEEHGWVGGPVTQPPPEGLTAPPIDIARTHVVTPSGSPRPEAARKG